MDGRFQANGGPLFHMEDPISGNSWQAAVNPCKSSISKSSTFIKEPNILTYLQLKRGRFQSNLVGMIIIRESRSENEPVGITFRVS